METHALIGPPMTYCFIFEDIVRHLKVPVVAKSYAVKAIKRKRISVTKNNNAESTETVPMRPQDTGIVFPRGSL